MKFGSNQSALCTAIAAVAATLAGTSSAHGQAAVVTGTWQTVGSESWNNAANWDTSPFYPSGQGASAIIPSNHTVTRTISLNEAVTLGSLTVENNLDGNTTNIQVIQDGTGGALTFDAATGSATITSIGTGSAQTRLNATMILQDTLVADVQNTAANTAGAFSLLGLVSGPGGFTKTGPGRATMAFTPGTSDRFKTYTGPTVIANGRLRMSHGSRPTATSSFTIQAGGQLNPISIGTFTYDFNGGAGTLSIAGDGPSTGPDATFKGAILPDANTHITFTNPVLLPGGPAVVHSRGTAPANASITFTNAISGAGTLKFSPDAGDGQFGTYFLKSTASDYTGGTTIWGGTLDATQGNLGATTGPLSVNVIPFGGNVQTTVLLNTSTPTTVGSLSGTLNPPALPAVHTSTISNGGQLFTVNQTTAGTYDGVITGAGGLTLGSLSTNALTLTGNNTYTGTTTVNAGTLVVRANAIPANNAVTVTGGTYSMSGGGTVFGLASLTINGGEATVASHGSTTLSVKALSIAAADAKLNTTDNDLILDHDGSVTEESIRQHVRNGRAAGSTSGIFSTPGSPIDDKVLAIADNGEWGKTVFNGINIDPTTIVGKYTYFGDSNLDGQVTGDDYLAIDAGLGTGNSWIEGDFNMSTTVTGDDYLAIDANLGKGTANPLAFAEMKAEMVAAHVAMFGEDYLAKLADVEANGFEVVPEPGALSLIGLGAIGLLGRRRRQA